MSLKGILFDFDGVVVKSMEQHYEAWKNAFWEKGVTLEAEEFFVMEGQGIQTISNKLGKQYGLSTADIRDIMDRKINYYNRFMRVEFYPYFPELLALLKDQQIPRGIVTGGSRERVHHIVDNYFNNDFLCVVTVDDVKQGKPSPDPFLKGAEMLKLAPEACIVVENAPMGIRAALRAGMTVIAITTTLTEDYLSDAHYIARDFREVEQYIRKLI